MKKKNILIFYDYFAPAYKAGGPIRSLVNLVNFLSEHYTFYIITGNTDHDGELLSVQPNVWTSYQSKHRVAYVDKEHQTATYLKHLTDSQHFDKIYINGIFSAFTTLLPLKIFKEKHNQLIIAPRGMLQANSLKQKWVKKQLYLWVLKYLYLSRKITWHFTTRQERDESTQALPAAHHVLIPNVPYFQKEIHLENTLNQEPVFGTVALIHPMKNIHLVLEALGEITVPLQYCLYGPIKDEKYWKSCQKLIAGLPAHIQVTYHGSVQPDKVSEVIKSFDFYIQPSKSENFGHSIFEAFNVGRPVITSNNTPWQNLSEQQAGWNVSTEDYRPVLTALREALKLTDHDYEVHCRNARNQAEKFMIASNIEKDYLALFST